MIRRIFLPIVILSNSIRIAYRNVVRKYTFNCNIILVVQLVCCFLLVYCWILFPLLADMFFFFFFKESTPSCMQSFCPSGLSMKFCQWYVENVMGLLLSYFLSMIHLPLFLWISYANFQKTRISFKKCWK